MDGEKQLETVQKVVSFLALAPFFSNYLTEYSGLLVGFKPERTSAGSLSNTNHQLNHWGQSIPYVP